jgi:hypothetical protein
MFSITYNSRAHPDQSSRPEMQCLRATDASGLAHQITNSSSHSFNAACRSWQMQLGIFAIGSEMVDPPQKLPNDHAYDTQSCGLANKIPQLFEHGSQLGTVGELESLTGKLVERFAQGSAGQPAVSSASAVLQPADEMKMAKLHDPALASAEPDNSRNLVGDRGSNASVYGSRDGCDCLRPTLQVLPAWQEQRVEEDGSILMTRFGSHQVQDPIFSSKPEIKSIQDQNQRSSRQAQGARLRYELAQRSTKTATESLPSKAEARGEGFQCASVQQNCLQHSRTCSPQLATSLFDADSPRTLAVTALTTSRTEPMDVGSATRGFRVPRMHARELHTDSDSKYRKTRGNSV